MCKIFIPNIYAKDIFHINYDKLKDNNIKCLLIDLDNTVSPAKEVILSTELKELFDSLKKDFKLIIFSNNKPKRVQEFGNYYDVDVASFSLKPISYKYIYILKKYGYQKNEVAAIGDQLLTDIQGGNIVGMTTILVDPMCEIDEKVTYLSRTIESVLYKRFKKKNILVKGKYYD